VGVRIRFLALGAIAILLAVSCGNSKSSGSKEGSATPGSGTVSKGTGGKTAVNQPGVTDDEIRVGGIASITNPLGTNYGTAFDGVEAYFDMINDAGGIYGRKLKVAYKGDDQLGSNQREAQALVQQGVFAALPIAVLLFQGADILANAKIPTFGWNIQDEWIGPENFFEQEGALCIDCPGPFLPWLTKKLNKKNIAVLGYNVPQSADCAKGIKATYDKYPDGGSIVFDDESLSFGVADLSADVQRMKDRNVDFVATCMDQNGVLTLTREMKKQGLDAAQSLPNAYDHDYMDKYGELFEGGYVRTRFAPFEFRPQSKGLRLYNKWIEKSNGKKAELSLVGWIDADMFVTGLRAAGPNFTREKVVAELNKLKNYDAQGLLPGLDWTIQHKDPHNPKVGVNVPAQDCFAITQVKNKKFVPTFTAPGKPFMCFPSDPPSTPANYTNKA
jgi:ABC-type branched-subunit amino acid transport system substrate-binding protein